jgi:hypothetical protein
MKNASISFLISGHKHHTYIPLKLSKFNDKTTLFLRYLTAGISKVFFKYYWPF